MNKLDILINNFGIKHVNYITFENGNLSISFYSGEPFHNCKYKAVNDINNYINGAEIKYTIDATLSIHYYDSKFFDYNNIEKRISDVVGYLLKQFLNLTYFQKLGEAFKVYSYVKRSKFYCMNLEQEIHLDKFEIFELSRTYEEYISAKTNQGADGKYRDYTDIFYFFKYDGVLVYDSYLKQFLPDSTDEIQLVNSISNEDNLSICFRKDLTDTFKNKYSKPEHLNFLKNQET